MKHLTNGLIKSEPTDLYAKCNTSGVHGDIQQKYSRLSMCNETTKNMIQQRQRQDTTDVVADVKCHEIFWA